MTKVAFHFNVENRLYYTCRLVRKAVVAGNHVVVTGSGEILARFDRDLWTFAATEFVPHGYAGDPETRLQRTPVLLCESLDDVTACDVLVNLADTVPAGFETFDRVVEVVTADPIERSHARQRWKHYSKAGLGLIQHDLSQRTAP